MPQRSQHLRGTGDAFLTLQTLSCGARLCHGNFLDNRPGYIPRSTLRRWHKSSAQRERAFGADAAPSTPCAKGQPTKPRNCANADNKSSPALRSSCAKGRPSKPRNFSNAEKLAMHKAVSSTPNWQDAWAAIQKAVPGISYENPQAEKYVPKSTLEEWRRHPTRLAPKPAANTWTEESARFFSVSVPRPNLRQARQASHPSDTWFSSSSWTFCPKCGRHRPHGHASKDTVSAADECRPCCDTSAEDLLEPFEGHLPSKLMAYVTPQMCNWLPIMESATVTDTVLQHVEVAALQVLDIYVDYRTRRGGKAEVVSKQKTSVVRAEWRAESLLTLRKDESQKAIFDWLMHNNTTYRQFVKCTMNSAKHSRPLTKTGGASPLPLCYCSYPASRLHSDPGCIPWLPSATRTSATDSSASVASPSRANPASVRVSCARSSVDAPPTPEIFSCKL